MLSKDRAAAPFPAGLSTDCHGDSEWAQKDDVTALPSHPGLCAELPHGLVCSTPSLSEPPLALTPVDTAPPGYGGRGLVSWGRGYVFSWADSVASLQAFIIYVHTHTHTHKLCIPFSCILLHVNPEILLPPSLQTLCRRRKDSFVLPWVSKWVIERA